ncbi:MAG: substrate-binding domain-containing protein [Lachnospiraceae bacterium]|jgi:ribose transport system substrate-binding protein|nr:substrate-binding domain-containing protein [Lachnospiraceae bacterium]
MKRKNIFWIIGLTVIFVIIIFAVTIMVSISTDSKLNKIKGKTEIKYKYHVAFIKSSGNDEIWDAIYKGAKANGEKDGIYVEDFGGELDGDYSRVDLLRMAIDSKVDGIILEYDGSSAMQSLISEATKDREDDIEKARKQNIDTSNYLQPIPIITIMTDAPDSGRTSFVGPSDNKIGEIYGKEVVKSLEKKKLKESLNVDFLVRNIDQGNEQTSSEESVVGVPNQLYYGLKSYVNSHSKKIVIDEPKILPSEDEFASVSLIVNMIENKKTRPDAMVCLNTFDTINTYLTVVDENAVGDVQIIGYYYSKEILDKIDSGVIFSSVCIDANEIGKTSVSTIMEAFEWKSVSERITTPVYVIDKDNVQEFKKKLLGEVKSDDE